MSNAPGRRHLSCWIENFVVADEEGAARGPQEGSRRRCPAYFKMAEPALILDWLELSSFMKDVRKSTAASHACARILATSTGRSRADIISDIKTVGHEALRLARVRADAAAMLVWRRVYALTIASVGSEACSFYLFADASPQWRGVETFCATIDVRVCDTFQRRLLPITALQRCMLDTIGKGIGLLWQLWLLVGPMYRDFRQCCRQVRGVTTDMGVERGICDLPNFSSDFFGCSTGISACPKGMRTINGSSQTPFPSQDGNISWTAFCRSAYLR